MSRESSKREINEFIEMLKKAESVSIICSPPVPDIDEFYDAEKGDCLLHFKAIVEFSVK